jgi:two-component system response regulator HydG
MMEYDWPGNVRELEHSIERACALSSGPVLHMGDFPTQLQDHHRHALQMQEEKLRGDSMAVTAGGPLTGAAQNQVLSIAELEKQAILNTIRQMKGDKLLAAKLLGIGKTTLYRKLKEYDLGDDESLA